MNNGTLFGVGTGAVLFTSLPYGIVVTGGMGCMNVTLDNGASQTLSLVEVVA